MSAADATTLAALHPARDYNYLATLALAVVAGLPVGRTVADLVALADPAYHLSAASVVTLLNPPPTGLPATFTTAHIVIGLWTTQKAPTSCVLRQKVYLVVIRANFGG